MITNLVNPAVTAALRTPQTVTTFSTDGAAPITCSVNASVNDNKLIPANGTFAGLLTGFPVSTAGAGEGGGTPWITWFGSGLNSGALPVTSPAARAAVTGAVATQWERVETRFKAATILLENLTTGEKWTQNDQLNPNGAVKTAGSGAPATLTVNGIMNRTNCIAIYPDLLAPNCNFRLTLTYNYVAKV